MMPRSFPNTATLQRLASPAPSRPLGPMRVAVAILLSLAWTTPGLCHGAAMAVAHSEDPAVAVAPEVGHPAHSTGAAAETIDATLAGQGTWTARGVAARFFGQSPLQAQHWTAAAANETACVRQAMRFIEDALGGGWHALYASCSSPEGKTTGTLRSDGDSSHRFDDDFLSALLVSGAFVHAAAAVGSGGIFGPDPAAALEPGPRKGRIAATAGVSSLHASAWIEEWDSPDAAGCAQEAMLRAQDGFGAGANALRVSCAAPSGLTDGWLLSDNDHDSFFTAVRQTKVAGTFTSPWAELVPLLLSEIHPSADGLALPTGPADGRNFVGLFALALHWAALAAMVGLGLLFLRSLYTLGRSQGRRETIAAGITEAIRGAVAAQESNQPPLVGAEVDSPTPSAPSPATTQ